MSDDFLVYVRTPLIPFTMKCSCGHRLRVATGTWACNGLPCFWALCAHCERKPVWCPAGMHIRVQELFKTGINNTAQHEVPVPACVTGACAYRHKEMVDDLAIFIHRPGSEDAWVAEEKWIKRATTGPEKDLDRIAAGQIVRVRKFIREIDPRLQRRIREAREHGRPVPTLAGLMTQAEAGVGRL